MTAYRVVLDSPLGPLTLTLQGQILQALDYGDLGANADAAVAQPYVKVLLRYFDEPHAAFPDTFLSPDIFLSLCATPFRQRVWAALMTIAPGQTCSYGQLAKRLHSSPRAVGQACRHNPIPILLPCHRVLAAQGLGGYSGHTDGVEMQRKSWLLRHEGVGLD